MLNRNEALQLMRENLPTENMQNHSLATESLMRFLARHFDQDEEKWGLTGLLHDLDYETTAAKPQRHGLKTAEMLSALDVPEDVIYAIKAHPGHFPRKTLLDKALYAADPLTGLVTAAVMMVPSRKLADLKLKSLKKRFKDKRFAAGASREQILTCSESGIELDKFLEIGIESAQHIAADLGF